MSEVGPEIRGILSYSTVPFGFWDYLTYISKPLNGCLRPYQPFSQKPINLTEVPKMSNISTYTGKISRHRESLCVLIDVRKDFVHLENILAEAVAERDQIKPTILTLAKPLGYNTCASTSESGCAQ